MKKDKPKAHRHVAGFVDLQGRVIQWRANDSTCCAERLLYESLPHRDGRIVVVRARMYATNAIGIKSSQPCGKCVDVMLQSPKSVKRVIWSSKDGFFESCKPCNLPHNDYRARNAPRACSSLA